MPGINEIPYVEHLAKSLADITEHIIGVQLVLAPFPLAHVSVCHIDGAAGGQSSGLLTLVSTLWLMLCPYEELNECLFLRSKLIALDDMVSFLK